jgi:hypothetical protein
LSFRYDHGVAVDDELGLRVRLDVSLWDDGRAHFELRVLPDGPAWDISPVVEKEVRVYQAKTGPRPRSFDVAFRLSRASLMRVADELAALKAGEGLVLSQGECFEAIRQGLYTLQTGGGVIVNHVPDFAVTFAA